jgi:phosphate transport system protein
MSIDLRTELTECRRAILKMGAVVEQRVGAAIESLFDRDVAAARSVRMGDDEIDEMDLDIEAECLRILALSHPVAGDLRFVLAVMRINADLERIGDCAKGISKRVVALDASSPIELPPAVSGMAAAARQMLGDALAGLANHDAALCRQVRREDERVDDLLKEMYAWVQEEIPQHVETTRSAIDVLSVARKLERIADLSTNIAENVIFLVEGSVVRHQTS